MTTTENAPISELILHWDDEFSVGVPELDEQHKRLLRLVAFVATVARDRDQQIVRAVVQDIACFADVHFASEERVMEEYGYPGLQNHREEHQSFRKRIAEFLAPGEDGMLGYRVLQMMQDWLKTHLIDCDQRYAEFFRQEKKIGARTQVAFRAL